MAGRKPPPKPDLFSLLLGKMGLAPAKKKKGKRRKVKRRPVVAEPSFATSLEHEAAPEDYGSLDGYGFEPLDPGYESEHTYEAAAAAGFAPPIATAPGVSLPFDAPAPAPAPRADGKLFDQGALDSSLDDLFSGLEAGLSPGEPEAAVPEPLDDVSKVVPFPAAELEAPATPEWAAVSEPMESAIPEPLFGGDDEPYVPISDPIMPPEPIESQPAAYAPAAYAAMPGGVLSAERIVLSQGKDLRAVLRTIDRASGVAGSLLVGHDGLIIVATLGPEVDTEYLGAQACSLFAGSSSQSQKMGRGELRRMVLETAEGQMLMTAADMGILVVVSKDGQAMDMAGVSAAVHGALGYV